MKAILVCAAVEVMCAVPPASAKDTLKQIPATADVTPGHMRRPREGVGYEVLRMIRIMGGKIAICSVGKDGNNAVRKPSRKMMRRAMIELEGKVILKDMTFLAGSSAACP